MSVDPSGTRESVPERFSPREMQGQLIAAEHLSRYRWAASIAGGKRVLDAGCGTAYGTAILAAAGAREVVGVDIAEGVLESVRPQMPESVELQVGNLTALDLEDDGFDLVVCFEVIEHFEEPLVVIDELVRVLAPGGVLLVSSPNRGIYPPGNPHHHHEFTPSELSAELGKRLPNVQLMRQQTYVTAAILSDDQFERESDQPLSDLPLYKLVAEERDHEMFTLALAGDGELPPMPSLATMTSSVGLDEWVRVSREQERALQAHRRLIQELETKVSDCSKLQQLLIETEAQLANSPALQMRIQELESANADLTLSAVELASTKATFSWRITRPLRRAKALLRGLPSRG